MRLPCVSVSNLTWFSSQLKELLLRNRASVIYPEIFRAPCRKKLCVRLKNDATIFNGLGGLYHHSKFGEDCTMREVRKCGVYFFPAGFATKWQTAGIKFTHRAKISIFAPQGDLLHRFMWNLAWPRGTWVRLAKRNFTPIGEWGWEGGPKSGKFSLFCKESPRSGEPFGPISTTVRGFYTPNYPAIPFTFDMIRITGCGETARPAGKTIHWMEK